MPKLSHPKMTRADAVNDLMRLYREDADFVKELARLRGPYLPAIEKLGTAILDFAKAGTVSPEQYRQYVSDILHGKAGPDVFSAEEAAIWGPLQPYLQQAEQAC